MRSRGNYSKLTVVLCTVAAVMLVTAPALASKYYNFTYTYSDGDFYQGRGYINSTSADYANYVVNYTKTWQDENKAAGTYKITAVATSSDETKNGYVYVDKYYDKESNHIRPGEYGLKSRGQLGSGK